MYRIKYRFIALRRHPVYTSVMYVTTCTIKKYPRKMCVRLEIPCARLLINFFFLTFCSFRFCLSLSLLTSLSLSLFLCPQGKWRWQRTNEISARNLLSLSLSLAAFIYTNTRICYGESVCMYLCMSQRVCTHCVLIYVFN